MKELTYSEKYNWIPDDRQVRILEQVCPKWLQGLATPKDYRDIGKAVWFISHGPDAVAKVRQLESTIIELEKDLNRLSLYTGLYVFKN